MTQPKKKRGRPLGSGDPNSRSARGARWVRETGGSFEMAAATFGISRQAVDQAWHRLFPGQPPPWQQAIRDALRETRELEMSARATIKKQRHQHFVEAANRVLAGAAIPDVCSDLGLSYHSTREQLRLMGVRSKARGRDRMDGRIDAAIAAIALGVPIAVACRRARCAPQGVGKTIRRRAGEVIP